MKKVLVFLADGFEEVEAITVVDYLRRAGVDVDSVALKKDTNVKGSHGIIIRADKFIEDINKNLYDALYLPGGTLGANNLKEDDRVINLVKDFNSKSKLIAAICAAPIVLDKAGVLSDRKCVSFPTIEKGLNNIGEYKKDELVVCDHNIITSRGAAASIYLSLKLIEMLLGVASKEDLKPSIQEDFVEKYFNFKF